jgi:hypothetical protein
MARVTDFPGVLALPSQTVNDIRAATPVLGLGQWYEMALAQVWLLAHGGTLVMHGPYTDMDASQGFPCAVYSHPQNLTWLWVVTLSRTSTGANVFGHFVGAGGTTLGEWQLDSSIPNNTPQHFTFTEVFASVSEDFEFIPEVNVDSTSHACDLIGLHGYELPAHDVTVFGSADTPIVEPKTCTTHAPIYEAAGSAHESVAGLAEVLYALSSGAGLIGEARRVTLYSWASPVGVSTTSGSLVAAPIYESAPSIVARHMYNGVNTSTVRVRVYALVEGAPNTGEIVITAATGGTVTLTITSASLDWYGGNLTVETEDLARNDDDGGLRGGTRETFTVQYRTTGGSTAIGLFALFIGESETY